MSRQRRSKTQIEQLEKQILDVLVDDHPQSVRHVFYRMTDPRLPEPVAKTEQGYRQVQDRITKMRRAGSLDYRWITDATRRGYHVDTFQDAGDFLRSVAVLYRGDLWRESRHYVEVWCESRSIAGVIENDCRELAVSLYPSGGFTSISLAYQAAEWIRYSVEAGGKVDANILYIGDFDPAGVLIDQSIERELRKHLDGVDLEFYRIAINEEQIDRYDLPTKPRKASDRRRLDIAETVEAEAMPASELRRMLRTYVESFLPDNALHSVKVAEEAEREGLDLVALALSEDGLSTVVDRLEAGA